MYDDGVMLGYFTTLKAPFGNMTVLGPLDEVLLNCLHDHPGELSN